MKSVLASQITKALLLSFLTTSFVACKTVEQGSDFSSRSPASASLVSSKKSLQQSRSVNPQGPGDSSGGNGVSGKVYESYIVDITTFPEFKLIAPILEKMIEANGDSERKSIAEILAENKTWYIAPVKLKPIDKSILGVSFSKDETEQLAIQTKKAIWIDQEKWNAMTEPEDRAMLLLHEITMDLYLMQFEDYGTNCLRYEFTCPKLFLFNHSSAVPAPRRALTDDDYDNIRSATFWLANNAKTSTSAQVNQKLSTLSFDPRFYGPKAVWHRKYDNRGTAVSYEFGEATEALSFAQVVNKMPDKCYAIHLRVYFDCKITSTPARVNGLDGIKILVTGKNFSREALVIENNGTAFKSEDWAGSFPMELDGASSCQIGSMAQKVSLYAFDIQPFQNTARDIFVMLLEPQVVFRSDGRMSELAKPKVTTLETDTILAYRSDLNPDVPFLAYAAPWHESTHMPCRD